MAKFIFIIILWLAVLHEGSAKLKCYQCMTSSNFRNDACYDPRSSKNLKPMKCSDDLVSKFVDFFKSAVTGVPLEPVCIKMDIKVGGELVTRRECAMVPKNNYKNACTEIPQNLPGYLKYCGICDKDGCNHAPVLPVLPLSLSLMFAAVAMLV